MDKFEEIKNRYTLRLINATEAKGNTKYRIDDILTEFGDELLTQIEERIKGVINDFRFS